MCYTHRVSTLLKESVIELNQLQQSCAAHIPKCGPTVWLNGEDVKPVFCPSRALTMVFCVLFILSLIPSPCDRLYMKLSRWSFPCLKVLCSFMPVEQNRSSA